MTKLNIVLGLVLAAMCLTIPGMVWTARMRRYGDAHRSQQAETDALAIRSAVELYWANEPGAPCPTMGALVAERIWSSSTRTEDPWGNTFVIECKWGWLRVASLGADGRRSGDDIEERSTLPLDAFLPPPRDAPPAPDPGVHRPE